MAYLLDTCTISYFARGEEPVLTRIKTTNPDLFYVSSITVMEIEYGLKANPKIADKLAPIMNSLMQTIHDVPYSVEDAKISAAIRASLKKVGMPIGAYDILIAATAINHNLTLVTSNIKEFSRVHGLSLEDWRY